MVVIAIIIILAAIAIPNYLKMTERAKRSRLSSDFATLATVLETFKTDWGKYPVLTAANINAKDSVFRKELAGATSASTGTATINLPSLTNAVGEAGGIEYIKDGTLTSITNPFDATKAILYTSDGANWVIYTDIGSGTVNYLYRTSNMSTVSESGTTTPSY
jgi:type II secretory pathway pseudopilin PulG